MRIAVTGTHGSGKTTLIGDVAAAHPAYESVAEPYWLFAEDGTPFAEEPTIDDLEQQLVRSCRLMLEEATGANVIFDRSPLDFLGYLDVVGASEGVEWLPDGRLLRRIGRALASLDLLVFVPLRPVDEIAGPIELPALRAAVDRRLKTMLRDDDLGLLGSGPRIVEVRGTRAERLARVTAALAGG